MDLNSEYWGWSPGPANKYHFHICNFNKGSADRMKLAKLVDSITTKIQGVLKTVVLKSMANDLLDLDLEACDFNPLVLII